MIVLERASVLSEVRGRAYYCNNDNLMTPMFMTDISVSEDNARGVFIFPLRGAFLPKL